MKVTALSLACLSSVLFSACAHEPSLTMLEERADYEADEPEALALTLGDEGNADTPARTPSKVAHVWVHQDEAPDKDQFFWGAWVSVVVGGEEWNAFGQRGLSPQ